MKINFFFLSFCFISFFTGCEDRKKNDIAEHRFNTIDSTLNQIQQKLNEKGKIVYGLNDITQKDGKIIGTIISTRSFVKGDIILFEEKILEVILVRTVGEKLYGHVYFTNEFELMVKQIGSQN